MTNSTNYRVKVDLSMILDDIRKISCIYVDSKKISTIEHVKHHVRNVFGVEGPFHLLLNGDTFLPPVEDARIINDKETIVVVPRTNADNSKEKCDTSNTRTIENGISNGSLIGKKKKRETSKAEETENSISNGSFSDNVPNATLYHSMNETKIDRVWEPELKDESMYVSFDAQEQSQRKRKRVRRRKSLKGEKEEQGKSFTYPAAKKPQIICPSSSSAIHVRFNDSEIDGIDTVESETNGTDDDRKIIENGRKFGNGDLATLLAMKNCSTPRIYVNKKKRLDNETDSKAQSEESPKTQNEKDDSQTSKNDKTFDEKNDYANIEAKDYPLLEKETKINDVIAFKILKMGSEYTPEVSKYVFAKTLSWCPVKTTYNFEILHGLDEIREPTGKFSLPENEESESSPTNVVEYAFLQLLEPRLIQRQ